MRDYLYSLATDRHNGPGDRVVKVCLLLLSYVYGCIVRMLRLWRSLRTCRINGVRVISVGNITAGGTGKTPLVECVCGFLVSQGRSVAVVSRGYGRFAGTGDEPAMLRRRLPGVQVLVDSDRARAIRKARKAGADTVILDDGFQQWHLAKDLEIVALDSGAPFGNGHLLPRGMLREPVSSLRRAGVIVFTKTNLHRPSRELLDRVGRVAGQALVVEAGHEPLDLYDAADPRRVLPVEFLRGRKVAVFSAIGDPASFEELIRSCGGIVAVATRFRDHHPYAAGDVERVLEESSRKNIFTVITTEKDAVRLDGLIPSTCSVLVLRIRMALVRNEQLFFDRLLQLYPV